MRAMDHRPSDGHFRTCLWDEDPWPCQVARVREDLAELLEDAGHPEAAKLIDTEQ